MPKSTSFAEFIIEKYGEEYLEKIWNENNELSPWDYNKTSRERVLFNCEKNEKHIFDMRIENYKNGQRCSYCAGKKVLKEESLGSLYPDAVKYWSDMNEKTAYDYLTSSSQKVYWKCPNGVHDDFLRIVQNSVRYNFSCNDCTNMALAENGANNREDLTGQVFGDLIVKGFAYTKRNRAYWTCDCACGKKNVVKQGYGLRAGRITSCGDRSLHNKGGSNPNWKGGIADEHNLLRSTKEYKDWRNKSYKKDFYTCQCCGQHGGLLSAHHILDFATYVDLRLAVENSITMCDMCHDTRNDGSLHNLYGTIGVAPEELEEYINNRRKELGIPIPFSIDSYREGNILMPGDVEWAKTYYDYSNNKNDRWQRKNNKDFIKIKLKFRVKEEY